MLRSLLRSKIHGATVTETNLHYGGSITLGPELIAAADLLAGERVDVVNLNTGARITTYVIAGEQGSTGICLNGPAARTAQPGDKIHVLAYGLCDAAEAAGLEPTIVRVDDYNRPREE